MDPSDRTLATFALEIGLPLIMGAALALYTALTVEKKEEGCTFSMLLAAAGCAFAFMATTLFPWSHVRVLTRGLSDYLQFPWRFLMMTAVCFALCGGWGCAKFARGHGEQMAAAVLAVAALCALPTLTDETRNPSYIPFGQTVSPHLLYTEYTIPGSDTGSTLERDVLAQGDVQITDYKRDGMRITAQVSAQTPAQISLPIFGYDGYRAALGGEEIAWTPGENNRLTVSLPAGAQGELSVWFAGKVIWRAAEAVSLLALIGLALGRRKGRCV